MAIIDQLSSNAQPTADMLCTRGQCCSALGNNALVRCFRCALKDALKQFICLPPLYLGLIPALTDIAYILLVTALTLALKCFSLTSAAAVVARF